MKKGVLKGFVSINPRWAGFKEYDYINASRSVYDTSKQITSECASIKAESKNFDLRGYEIARSQFFDNTTDRISVTFTSGEIRFSTTAVKKIGSTPVELLIHPEKQILAVRTVKKDCKNAMHWGKEHNGSLSPREISGAAFLPSLFALLQWNTDCRYRIIGIKYGQNSDSILLFNLKETEIFIPDNVIREQTPSVLQKDIHPFTDSIKRNVKAYPIDWADNFGRNFYSHTLVQELAKFSNTISLDFSTEAIPYKDSDLQVTSQAEIEKNIEQILSDVREETS